MYPVFVSTARRKSLNSSAWKALGFRTVAATVLCLVVCCLLTVFLMNPMLDDHVAEVRSVQAGTATMTTSDNTHQQLNHPNKPESRTDDMDSPKFVSSDETTTTNDRKTDQPGKNHEYSDITLHSVHRSINDDGTDKEQEPAIEQRKHVDLLRPLLSESMNKDPWLELPKTRQMLTSVLVVMRPSIQSRILTDVLSKVVFLNRVQSMVNISNPNRYHSRSLLPSVVIEEPLSFLSIFSILFESVYQHLIKLSKQPSIPGLSLILRDLLECRTKSLLTLTDDVDHMVQEEMAKKLKIEIGSYEARKYLSILDTQKQRVIDIHKQCVSFFNRAKQNEIIQQQTDEFLMQRRVVVFVNSHTINVKTVESIWNGINDNSFWKSKMEQKRLKVLISEIGVPSALIEQTQIFERDTQVLPRSQLNRQYWSQLSQSFCRDFLQPFRLMVNRTRLQFSHALVSTVDIESLWPTVSELKKCPVRPTADDQCAKNLVEPVKSLIIKLQLFRNRDFDGDFSSSMMKNEKDQNLAMLANREISERLVRYVQSAFMAECSRKQLLNPSHSSQWKKRCDKNVRFLASDKGSDSNWRNVRDLRVAWGVNRNSEALVRQACEGIWEENQRLKKSVVAPQQVNQDAA